MMRIYNIYLYINRRIEKGGGNYRRFGYVDYDVGRGGYIIML